MREILDVKDMEEKEDKIVNEDLENEKGEKMKIEKLKEKRIEY